MTTVYDTLTVGGGPAGLSGGDTALEGVRVAGDLRPMTQQVSIALGTGNIAAVQIDQYLTVRDAR